MLQVQVGIPCGNVRGLSCPGWNSLSSVLCWQSSLFLLCQSLTKPELWEWAQQKTFMWQYWQDKEEFFNDCCFRSNLGLLLCFGAVSEVPRVLKSALTPISEHDSSLPQGDLGEKTICGATPVVFIHLQSTLFLSSSCAWNSHFYWQECIVLSQGGGVEMLGMSWKLWALLCFFTFGYEGLNLAVSSRFKKGICHIVFPPVLSVFLSLVWGGTLVVCVTF